MGRHPPPPPSHLSDTPRPSPRTNQTRRVHSPVLTGHDRRVCAEKVLVDELDDRAHAPRQTLPEFLYDYHLELLGEAAPRKKGSLAWAARRE